MCGPVCALARVSLAAGPAVWGEEHEVHVAHTDFLTFAGPHGARVDLSSGEREVRAREIQGDPLRRSTVRADGGAGPSQGRWKSPAEGGRVRGQGSRGALPRGSVSKRRAKGRGGAGGERADGLWLRGQSICLRTQGPGLRVQEAAIDLFLSVDVDISVFPSPTVSKTQWETS